MEKIIVEIDGSGNVKIEAVGFTGNACEQATAAMEKALGTTTDREKKPEYFQEDQTHIQTGN